MRYRRLGNTDLQVSVVGIGSNNFGVRVDGAGTKRVVDAAMENGITFFDTADTYGNKGGSETLLGEAIGARRKDLVIATKFGDPMDPAGTLRGASRGYIARAVEASLGRLRTDYIDLYQLHHPDPSTPIEETLRALDDLVRQGKVRYIGCSNFAAWQVADAHWLAKCNELTGFVSCQNEFSLLEREPEQELIPALQAYDMALLPYFPLASGMLSGKYHRGQAAPAGSRLETTPRLSQKYFTDSNWHIIDRLERFCRQRGRTLLELAFAWLLAHDAVPSVIAGAMDAGQVASNARAAEWELTADEFAEVNGLLNTAQNV
ncbi:MAG: aldo/keto reductase [Candidatus Eremiobacteraeota bacterium]|nr:aldo/keto reductase [Candidatus Eremiobacteraeota bacterium]